MPVTGLMFMLGSSSPGDGRDPGKFRAGQRVDIWAEHAPQVRWPCPERGTLLSVYDHSEEPA